MERVAYDEFSFFAENAEEFGLPVREPVVRREAVAVAGDRQLSALVWGEGPPELVLLHGSGQNAHTFDTVALALDRPLVAIDLPGHGHSDGSSGSGDGDADDVAAVVAALAPTAAAVVGMSAGGILALAMSARSPELVRKLVLVDILPSHDPAMAKRIHDFIDGPDTFPSFEELLARTVQFNPTRSVSSLRRGILHNAVQLDDGSWQWRHRRHRRATGPEAVEAAARRTGALWDTVAELAVPLLLVRGMADGSVLTDDQEAELRRRQPRAQVVRVEGAGHSVQGDRPLELAAAIDGFVRGEAALRS
jgi:pimeloyl-ACP methyl ester carboxylesterase